MTPSLLHPFRGSRAALCFALIALGSSCGGGGGGTTAPVKVATVDVAPGASTKNIGETVQLTATPKDASGNTLTGRAVAWLSSSNAIATVSSTGLVTAVTSGTATITAAIEGQTGTASLTVAAPAVASVTVAPTTLALQEGVTGPLTATPKAANGTAITGKTITWSSATPAVATVASTGVVTALTAGTSVITASVDGQSGTSTTTVSVNPCLHGVNITLGQSIDGTLDATTDCNRLYDDGSLADAYVLNLTTAGTVQIDLTSTAFDTYLRLERGLQTRTLEEENNDFSINSTNARITRALSVNTYIIWANSFTATGAGAYTLTVKTPTAIVGSVRLERATPEIIARIRGTAATRRGHAN